MGKLKINSITFAVAIVLLILSLFALAKTFDNNVAPFSIAMTTDGQTQVIDLYEDDNEYYLFLPNAYASYNLVSNYTNVLIDGQNINSVNINDLDEAAEHLVKFFGQERTLHILKTSAIPTMFITSKQNFAAVLNDREKTLDIAISVISADGKVEYLNNHGSIHGRGNSTWPLDKKPFTLILDNEESLLGMVKNKKYILLANGYDKSNIKNKLVFDFAKDLNFIYSPSAEYVDLYINGEYYGLYLLSEKIDIDKYDYNEDSYLFNWASADQINDNTFTSNNGTCFQVEYPKVINSKLKDDINTLEAAIANDNGWQALINMDSFARKYLLEELFGNRDECSLYFYYDGENYYAEPIWDYDLIAGVNPGQYRSPCLIEVNNEKYTDDLHADTWFYYLCQHEEFNEEVIKVYKKEFLPIIDKINKNIRMYETLINKSSLANDIRWHKMFSKHKRNSSIFYIKAYMEARAKFIYDLIHNYDNFNRINVKVGKDGPQIYTTLYGNTLNEIIDFANLSNVKDNATFYYLSTNKVIDKDAIIAEDITIYTEDYTEDVIDKKRIACLLCCFALASSFLALVYIDIRRYKK